MTKPGQLMLGAYLCAVYVLLVINYVGPRQPLAVDLLLGTIAYGLWRVWSLTTAMQQRLGLQIFWLSSLFMLLVPGVVQLSDGSFFWPTWGAYDHGAVTGAVILLCLGTLLVDLTYTAMREAPARVTGTPPLSRQHVRVFGGLCGLGVSWSCALLVALGPGFFLRSRGTVDRALAETFSLPWLGLGVTLGSALLSTLLVLGMRLWLAQPPDSDRYRTGCWLILIGLCSSVVNFPGGQARYPLLATLLLIGLVIAAQRNYLRLASYLLSWGFAPALYGVVRFQGAYNRDSDYDLGGAWRAVADLRTTLHHGDFDGLQMTIAGMRYAATSGHTWGKQLLSGVLFFVPRTTWPGKALPTGSLLAAHEAYDYTNLSAPLLLEGWLDFSWAGLILLAVTLGALLRRTDGLLRNPRTFSLYALTLIAFLPILLRGALLAVVAPVAAVFFWLWVSKYLSRRPARPGSQDSGTTSAD